MPVPRPVPDPGSPAQQQGSYVVDPIAPCQKGWPIGPEEVDLTRSSQNVAPRTGAAARARDTSSQPTRELSSPRAPAMYPEAPHQLTRYLARRSSRSVALERMQKVPTSRPPPGRWSTCTLSPRTFLVRGRRLLANGIRVDKVHAVPAAPAKHEHALPTLPTPSSCPPEMAKVASRVSKEGVSLPHTKIPLLQRRQNCGHPRESVWSSLGRGGSSGGRLVWGRMVGRPAAL